VRPFLLPYRPEGDNRGRKAADPDSGGEKMNGRGSNGKAGPRRNSRGVTRERLDDCERNDEGRRRTGNSSPRDARSKDEQERDEPKDQ